MKSLDIKPLDSESLDIKIYGRGEWTA